MTIYTGATTKTYFYITDHLGTVHAIVDESGAVVESYRYDAWGRVLGTYDGSGSPLAQSAIGNRYLWQGREYSWATGLYYFRARWYDPITGRWLSNDPIGINGGLNQYVFCSNNPINVKDPFGLSEKGDDIADIAWDVVKFLADAITGDKVSLPGPITITEFGCTMGENMPKIMKNRERFRDELKKLDDLDHMPDSGPPVPRRKPTFDREEHQKRVDEWNRRIDQWMRTGDESDYQDVINLLRPKN